MKHIIAVLLENEAGALSRVVGLFSARGYNIETLTVAPTEDPSLSLQLYNLAATLQNAGDNPAAEPYLRDWERELAKAVKLEIRRVVANPVDIERYQVEFYNLAKSIKGANKAGNSGSGIGNLEQLVDVGGGNKQYDANDAHIVRIVDWLWLTGLAAVGLIVVIATAVATSVRRTATENAVAAGPPAVVATVAVPAPAEKSEPLATLGVAPDAKPDAKDVAPAPAKPAN